MNSVQDIVKRLQNGDGDQQTLLGELARAKGLTSDPHAIPSQGIGQLDACIVTYVLKVEEVERLLPAGLELAPQPVVPSGYHPVFVMFNHDNFDVWLG